MVSFYQYFVMFGTQILYMLLDLYLSISFFREIDVVVCVRVGRISRHKVFLDESEFIGNKEQS